MIVIKFRYFHCLPFLILPTIINKKAFTLADKKMSENIVSWYWTIYLMVFIYWFLLFYLDSNTSKIDLLSWTILLVAPLLWPIILPLSSWELSRNSLKNILL